MSLYLIAIGGTGAKCVEAFVHIAATGILKLNKPVRILFVDPDEANGNLDRTRDTIRIYQQCYQLLARSGKIDPQKCPWMGTKIELFEPHTWSPINTNNKTLANIFNYNDYQKTEEIKDSEELGHPLRNLFDTLYNKGEREMELDVGFRGRPAIGSAVMSQLDLHNKTLEQEPWHTFLESVLTDADTGTVKIFLFGSAFGGTGASGFPTIARLLANKLKDEGKRNKVQLGGALMLPYFSFPPKGQKGKNQQETTDRQDIYARSQDFLLNTTAALRYYQSQYNDAETGFDTIYLLGNQDLATVGDFSIGKGSQKNDPHIMELYAALAVDHFYKHKPKQRGEAVVMSRHQENQITWQDMPEGVKSRLVNTTRFAFAWLIDMKEFFEVAKERGFDKFMRFSPWSRSFFGHSKGNRNLPDFDSELGKLSLINHWCREYLTWLGKIHRTTENSFQIRLFNDDAFFTTEGKITNQSENFNRLVAGEANENDTVQRLTKSLIYLSRTDKEIRGRGGTVGLARVLYVKSKK